MNTRGTVQGEEVPRSYWITTNKGNELRRNRLHIRSLPEDPNQNPIARTNLDNLERESNNRFESSSFSVPVPSRIVTTWSDWISKPSERLTMWLNKTYQVYSKILIFVMYLKRGDVMRLLLQLVINHAYSYFISVYITS